MHEDLHKPEQEADLTEVPQKNQLGRGCGGGGGVCILFFFFTLVSWMV